jgi:threonine dehydrogenase-like Zn-dependent dehydrogenase
LGHPSRCENLDGGPQGPGFLIGACAGAGGGWSERYAAPAWRLFRVPGRVDDEEASLVEPFSICLHAVLRQPSEPGQHALVLGAGTIGLLTVASLRAVCPGVKITCTAKYPFQGELAGTLGADTVIDAEAPDTMDQIARATGSSSFPLTGGGSLLRTGADWTCDTVTNANS